MTYKEPKRTIPTLWDGFKIEQARRSARAGDFRSMGDLSQYILETDGRVASKLSERVSSIGMVDLSFDTDVQLVAQALQTDFPKMAPINKLEELQKHGIMSGIAVGHVSFSLDDSSQRKLPVIDQVFRPSFISYDQIKDIFSMRLIDSDGHEKTIPISPGVASEDGHAWVIYRRYGSVMDALWTQMAELCLQKRYARSDWAKNSERHGQGLYFVESEEVDSAKLQEAINQMTTVGAAGIIALPSGMRVVKNEPPSNADFKVQIENINGEIDILILGENLTTSVDGKGSYAAAKVHQEIRDDRIDKDLDSLLLTIQNQLLPLYIDMNFGGSVPTIVRSFRKPARIGSEVLAEAKLLRELSPNFQVDRFLIDNGYGDYITNAQP